MDMTDLQIWIQNILYTNGVIFCRIFPIKTVFGRKPETGV